MRERLEKDLYSARAALEERQKRKKSSTAHLRAASCEEGSADKVKVSPPSSNDNEV